VFLEGPEIDKFEIPLEPVISDPIYDKKLLSKLTITDISTNCTIASGGKVMIFSNYINEDDIEVLFFESDEKGVTQWQSLANLKSPFGEVHKRVGLSFIAPSYRDTNITQVVQCFMQLRRISDHQTSDRMIFYYLPVCDHNCPFVKYYHLNETNDIKCKKKFENNQIHENLNIEDKQKGTITL
jgi:Rel/ankyrin family protein